MSSEWASEHLFFRQVNPAHWDGTRPSSQAFVPFPKDRDKLSLDDSGLVSAEGAWRHFTEDLGFAAVGTWAINLDEVMGLELMVEPSPVVDKEELRLNNAAHCHIDFSSLSTKGKKRKKAQTLAILASDRGCVYRPNN